MVRFNDIYIVGIDHGYGNLKTANIAVPSGVKVYDIEPPITSGLLEYDSKYIRIGESHKAFNADKTSDMDNYYLTLYGIAREFASAGITEGNVHLAVGLPLMWVSVQRGSFTDYLMRNKKVEYAYNGKHYKVSITGVTVFPQSYCAVYDRLREMDGLNMIADIGNGTMNIMKVNDHKVITDSCRTEKLGVEKCVIEIQNSIMNSFQTSIDESIVTKFLIGKPVELPSEYAKVMQRCAAEYCRNILDTLYKYDYNSQIMKLFVVGGGAVVMKNFSDIPPKTIFITDVCANAKGYEYLALRKLRR